MAFGVLLVIAAAATGGVAWGAYTYNAGASTAVLIKATLAGGFAGACLGTACFCAGLHFINNARRDSA